MGKRFYRVAPGPSRTLGNLWLFPREDMTVTEAAAALGVSESSVRRMIRRGKLRAKKVKTDTGQELQIRESDVQAAVTPPSPGQLPAEVAAPSAEELAAVTPPSPDQNLILERLARIEGALAGQWQSELLEEISRLRKEVEENAAREKEILAELRRPWWKRWH